MPGPWDVREEFEARPSLSLLSGLVIGITALAHPLNLLFIGLIFCPRPLRGRVYGAIGFAVGLAITPSVSPGLGHRTFLNESGVISSSGVRTDIGYRSIVELGSGAYYLATSVSDKPIASERVAIHAVARPPQSESGQSQVSGIRGTILATHGELRVVSGPNPFFELGEGWREAYRGFLRRSLPSESAELVEAMTFGPDNLSTTTKRRLRAAGAVSVASISGLQVLFGSAAFIGLLRRFPIGRAVQLLLLSFGLAAYASATGMHPGIIRASILCLVLSGSSLLKRDGDAMSALCLCAAGELLIWPNWVYDLGFQLSFAVVAVLALYLPGLQNKRSAEIGLKRQLSKFAAFYLLILLATSPLLAYHLGEINLTAPLTFALVGPAVPSVLVLGCMAWISSIFSPAAGAAVLNFVVGPLAGWVLAVSETMDTFGRVAIAIPPFSGYWLVLVYALLALGARNSSSAFRGLAQ